MAKKKLPDKQDSSRNLDGTYKQGFSGNYKGRPPGDFAFTTRMKKKILEVAPEHVKKALASAIFRDDIKAYTAWMKKEVLWLDCFLEAKFHHALTADGDQIFKFIVEQIDGRAIQRIAGVENEAPIKFQEEIKELNDNLSLDEVRLMKRLQDKAKGRQ